MQILIIQKLKYIANLTTLREKRTSLRLKINEVTVLLDLDDRQPSLLTTNSTTVIYHDYTRIGRVNYSECLHNDYLQFFFLAFSFILHSFPIVYSCPVYLIKKIVVSHV